MPNEEQIRELHEDNATPLAPDDIQRTDKDTPFHGQGPTGASANQGVRADVAWAGDPKSAGTPVHTAPSQERPGS
jgi:hypothetical protein